MDILLILVSLIVLASNVLEAKEPTAPPFHAPEKGPPKDEFNCMLNALSVLPWVVSVWDKAEQMVVGHGSMMTYIAFITTCRQYNKAPSAYAAHGQFVWNPRQPLNPCMQSQDIAEIIKHPNCNQSMSDWSYYNYAIFKLKTPFVITGNHYPLISLPNSQEELMDDVVYTNSRPNAIGCFLVSFRSQMEKKPVFNMDVAVQVIPFHERCVKLLCEMNPANPSASRACEREFSNRTTSTMLCMKNTTNERIELGKADSYWIAGSPLLCNGSAYGIATHPKLRHDYARDKADFHYIATFNQVLPWIGSYLKKFSPPWIKDISIGKKSFVVEGNKEPVDPTTKRPRPTELPLQFIHRSNAALFTPSILVTLQRLLKALLPFPSW